MADLKTQLKNVFTSGDTYNVLTLLKKLIDELEGITFATPENIQELSDAVGALDTKIDEETGAIDTRVDTLETTVGDSSSGLVKDATDLKTTVGDSSSGLVKDVTDLKTTVGDSSGGLVEDVDILTSAIYSHGGLAELAVNTDYRTQLMQLIDSETYFDGDLRVEDSITAGNYNASSITGDDCELSGGFRFEEGTQIDFAGAQIADLKPTFHRHKVKITTEYGGVNKYLIFTFYLYDDESYTAKMIMDNNIANYSYRVQCTGNIYSDAGVITGICEGWIGVYNDNYYIYGINSNGDIHKAYIQNLVDAVTEFDF